MTLVMVADPRVMYSDSVHVVADRSGVTLHFGQSAGLPQPLAVARVGMSREQAYNVLHTLQVVLKQSESPGLLPPSVPTSSVEPKKKPGASRRNQDKKS